MNDEPVLDFYRALAEMGDDREIYEEVIKSYFLSVPGLFDEMESAVTREDRETVRRSAHSIKSSSRAVGAMRLGALGERLEKDAGEMPVANAQEMVGKMREEYYLFCQAAAGEGLEVPPA